MERRYATDSDFEENIDILVETWGIYKRLYQQEIEKTQGIINVDKINKLIVMSKIYAKAQPEHEIAIEGLFDSYVGVLFTSGDSRAASTLIDMKLKQILGRKVDSHGI